MELYVLAGIVDYMNKQRGEPAKPVDKAALKYFLKEDDISVLGFFNADTDPHLRIFQDACKFLAVSKVALASLEFINVTVLIFYLVRQLLHKPLPPPLFFFSF